MRTRVARKGNGRTGAGKGLGTCEIGHAWHRKKVLAPQETIP